MAHYEVELGWIRQGHGFEWLPHGGHAPRRFRTPEAARRDVRGLPGAAVYRVVRVGADGSRTAVDR